MNARGPAFEHYAQQLQEECNQVWWNGRHLCEASSMTGQPCVYPVRFFFLKFLLFYLLWATKCCLYRFSPEKEPYNFRPKLKTYSMVSSFNFL